MRVDGELDERGRHSHRQIEARVCAKRTQKARSLVTDVSLYSMRTPARNRSRTSQTLLDAAADARHPPESRIDAAQQRPSQGPSHAAPRYLTGVLALSEATACTRSPSAPPSRHRPSGTPSTMRRMTFLPLMRFCRRSRSFAR